MDTAENNIKKIFDSWAGNNIGNSMAKSHEELFLEMLNGWEKNLKLKILDVGCGNGFTLQMLKQMGYNSLSGIDFSSKMIQEAKRIIPEAELIIGTMEKLPWNDKKFDRIFSIEAIYYSSNPFQVINEMRRILKLEGQVDIIIEYYKDNPGCYSWAKALEANLVLWSEAEWIEIFTKGGFENISASRILRKTKKSEDEFKPDEFFPSYEIYTLFKEKGALHLKNYTNLKI